MTIHKISHTYTESYAGKAITELLQKLAQLKERHRFSKSEKSPKHIHAQKTLELMELVLEKVHHTILPQFDNYTKPGLFSIITDLIQLYRQCSARFKDLDKLEFKISDPSTFELAELLINLIKNAPEELNEFAPFLIQRY